MVNMCHLLMNLSTKLYEHCTVLQGNTVFFFLYRRVVETAGLALEKQKSEDGILISFGVGIGGNNLYLYSFLYLQSTYVMFIHLRVNDLIKITVSLLK